MTPGIAQSVNATSALGYTVYPHMDIQFAYDLAGTASCFSVPEQTAAMTAVNACNTEKGLCCVHLDRLLGSTGIVVSMLTCCTSRLLTSTCHIYQQYVTHAKHALWLNDFVT